ncbi:hypothetical protein [Gaiella occulta]|uniref:hypothetical protein n=1 Tax=Gaiella occulta TaxID=1002870 RepID=UPI0015F00E94|nr:hypothetical protein [Gaiella occulta]
MSRARRSARRWFAFYSGLLATLAVVTLLLRQWAVAATTLALTVAFALYTRRAWRRR